MKKDEPRQQYLAGLADNVLSKFTEISKGAKQSLEADSSVRADFLAAGNTFNAPNIIQNLVEGEHAARSTARQVAEEPAIARVVAADENGNEKIVFINRITSWNPSAGVIGYRSPMGRLASVPAGEEVSISTPSGTKIFVVLERALLHPRIADGEWDSVDSNVEREKTKPITIISFRALLPAPEGAVTGDILAELLADELAAENVQEGIRRGVITKMALRDRPILDQIQDEIFRLPLGSRLLVLGPPGSGKTTTLIRRLGQKLDVAVLEADERSLVERGLTDGQPPHSQSWLMFTPTELLKQFVKEAFAREGIPASDQRIKTWADYSRDLARNTFRILKSGAGRGPFILRENEAFVLEATLDEQINWFEDFNAWQDSEFWSDLNSEAEKLVANKEPYVASLGRRLSEALKATAEKSFSERILAIAALREDVQTLAAEKREAIKNKIDRAMTLQLNKDRTLVDQIVRQLAVLSDIADDPDDQDLPEEDEEYAIVTKSGRIAAASAFRAALRAQARMEFSKRRLARESRSARLLEWLGERSLSSEDRVVVGENIEVEVSTRRFLSPARRYIETISARYRRYRRQRQDEQRWYRADDIESARISPLEVDAILLAILRAGKALLSEGRIQRDLDNPALGGLSQIRELLRNQILVDEASDFSPIQLACMESLCAPEFRSFFACGDFNQRITEWGVRSEEEFRWAVRGLGVRTMTTTYRHSRQLNEFAGELVRISGGRSNAVLPNNINAEGVPPALGANLRSVAEVAAWLAKRIAEVERLAEMMPSIAVLVNNETEVSSLAEALSAALTDQNIRAVPCFNGQTMGQGADVRVFDVQHIKGLEFEAVFFVGIDKFAEQNPKLFDKYLYVGATRAATYLGVTCEGSGLPANLASLKTTFEKSWLL